MLTSQPNIILVFQCALLLSACGQQESGELSGQVIAKVNGEEISIHQVNFMLSQNPGVSKDNLEAAKTQIARALIDQTLLNQQAKTDKLDREPQIMMAVEQAKQQILARAWLEKAVGSAPKPTNLEVEQYYQAHPELFAKHKTFKLKELLITKKPENQSQIQQIIVAAHKIDDIVKLLATNNIAYTENLSVQGAENLPIQQLASLSILSDGQFIIMDQGSAVLVRAVLSATEESVDIIKAAPIIETFLLNQQRKNLIEKRLKELKDQASIEFSGEFSKLNKNTLSVSEPVSAKQPTLDDKTQHDVIDKGVKGL